MEFLAWLLVTILQVIPLWRILPRAGIASPWALAAALPLGALVLLWVLAFRRWPQDGAPGRFG
jgi:hypothetical protein